MSDELKQKEVHNTEKENIIKVKKQTIDLLPDAENNLIKLQVWESSSSTVVINSNISENVLHFKCVYFRA